MFKKGNCHFNHCPPFLFRIKSQASLQKAVIDRVFVITKKQSRVKLSNQKLCSGHVNQLVNTNYFLCKLVHVQVHWKLSSAVLRLNEIIVGGL